ncbi:hypothetical protein FRB95_014036 [Tulasnella sp. JGI-2019a]|nr:hypothetical protein FRB93_001720 [Tulasnella sp. JGI-2019a]KAG9033957.1 hypothetical protein FRB95_014036 [Tulasnella sp. JGI-2019a]
MPGPPSSFISSSQAVEVTAALEGVPVKVGFENVMEGGEMEMLEAEKVGIEADNGVPLGAEKGGTDEGVPLGAEKVEIETDDSVPLA